MVRELLPGAIFISAPRYNKWEWKLHPKNRAFAGKGIGKVNRERDLVAVEMACWLFISCYFLSNVTNNQIPDKLEEIGGIIAASNKMPIVAGDLNAKSPA